MHALLKCCECCGYSTVCVITKQSAIYTGPNLSCVCVWCVCHRKVRVDKSTRHHQHAAHHSSHAPPPYVTDVTWQVGVIWLVHTTIVSSHVSKLKLSENCCIRRTSDTALGREGCVCVPPARYAWRAINDRSKWITNHHLRFSQNNLK